MRVSKNSNVANIAGALAGSLRSGDDENLDVMGIETTYNAVKAIILASHFIRENDLKPVVEITTFNASVGKTETERTIIRFIVHPVPIGEANA